MAIREYIKDVWRTEIPWFVPVAGALNRLAKWCNTFDADPPIVAEPVPGGVRLHWSPYETPWAHPWRFRIGIDSGTLKYTVEAGRLYDGTTWHDVAAIEETALPAALKVWLQVKYYNDPATPAEHTIEVGADWPTDDYETDTIPNALDPTTLPAAGWCLTHIRLAEYSTAGGVVQHVFSDVLLPYGRTYAISRVLDHQWASSVMQHIVAVDTMVRGIVIATAAPTLDSVFDTGPCPQ